MARGENGKLSKVDWQDALTVASDAIADAGENIAVVVGPFADVETMCLAKDLANKAGSEMVTTEQSFIANGDLRSDYTFNSTIAGIEEADRVIIIGNDYRSQQILTCSRLQPSIRSSTYQRPNPKILAPQGNRS